MTEKYEHAEERVAEYPHDDLVNVDIALQGQKQELISLLRTAKSYRKGITPSLLMGLVIVMRCYDIVLIGSFYGFPSFRDRYGKVVPGDPSAGKQISGPWQVALGVASLVGQIIGSFLVTIPMERYGRRPTLLISLFLTSALTFMQFFSQSIQVLTASEYLSGVVWGTYQVLIPTFASELMPTKLRPFLTGYINACYNIGGLIASGIVKGFDSRTDEWGYRIPFALQWIWPVLCIPIVFISPESPWWLTKNGKTDMAEKALEKLTDKDSPDIDIKKTLEMMKKTVVFETVMEEDTTSFKDCFKGRAFRRTEIATMVFICQDFAGMFLSPSYFFEQVGLSTDQSYDLSIGVSAATLVSTLLAIFFLVPYYPRRLIFVSGLGICAGIMLISGILASLYQTTAVSWAQGILLLVCDVFYCASIGPLTYTYLTEVPSTRLKSKTVSISIAVDAICGIITSVANPYLINPGEANLKGKSMFLWSGISIVNTIWAYFRLPETRNRTYEEIDILFENGIAARKFSRYLISDEELRNDLEVPEKVTE
jgi:MFS transporter, SP family, general alpha glucoside:H+ symporter